MTGLNIKLHKSKYDNLIYRVLDRSGIEDKDLFLSQPQIQCFKTDDKIQDMDRGIELLRESVEHGVKIGILIDPDVDGFTSSALFIQFMNRVNPNSEIKTFFHSKHGIKDKELLDKFVSSDIELLILPDSSSNDFDEQEYLLKEGIKTIIIDHHMIDDESRIPETSIIINNQRKDQVVNKNLTGAGMMLKFIYYYYDKFHKDIDFFKEAELFNLAAVGQIGDASDISDIEIRFIVELGLRKIENSLFKTILEDTMSHVLKSKYDKLAPIDISFSINPLINAVARIGSEEEMAIIFNALHNSHNEHNKIEVKRRRKNKKTKKMENTILQWTEYELAYDYMKKIKRRQDKVANDLKDKVVENISANGGIAVSLIEGTTDEENSVLGLTANRIADELEKPTLLLRENKDIWTGSGRSYKDHFDSFRDWCNETNLVEFAQGHDSAFGIGVDDDNIEKLIAATLEVTPDKTDKIYYVDELTEVVNEHKILEGYLSRWVTGGSVDKILFGYKNVRINTKFIKEMKTMTKIWEQGVEFLLFNDHGSFYNEAMNTGDNFIKVDIVGEPKINTWFNKEQMQIIVRDIKITG